MVMRDGFETAARLVDVAHERAGDPKAVARLFEPRGLWGQSRDRLADLAEAEDSDLDGADTRRNGRGVLHGIRCENG